MILVTTKYFEKRVAKLPKMIKVKLAEKIRLFMDGLYNIILNNHKLNGKYKNYRSINITGDYRMIYEQLPDNSVRLIDVGTHGELYE